MRDINLLPWRLMEHRRRLTLFLWQLLVCIIFSILFYALFSSWNKTQGLTIDELYEQFEQIQHKTDQVQQQIVQFRRQTQETEQQRPLATESARRILADLMELPFYQGELDEFVIDAEHLRLKGKAATQQEFEEIHQFLRERFAQIRLTHFESLSDRLQFEFEIRINDSEAN